MTIEQIQAIIRVLQILIPIMVFLFILNVALSYQPGKSIVKRYERVNKQLKEIKSSFFDYENTERFLKANGAYYHYGKSINPIRFLILRIILASILFVPSIRLHWLIAVVLALVGFQIPVWWILIKNKKDNDRMLLQIKNLYMSLVIQIQAGGNISHIMSVIYEKMPRGRLRTALEEMKRELFLMKDFDVALDQFNRKFNNTSINSLCTILNQAQESGKAVELLLDMSEEIRGMKALQYKKHRKKFKQYMSFCYIGVMVGTMWVVICAFATELIEMAKAL